MNADQWIDQLNWRYATKIFDNTKTIEPALWQKIEESLVLTPSSFGLQPWKFIVVTDDAVKQSLVEHSWSQPQVADCSHLVVLAARKSLTEEEVASFIQSTADARSVPVESLEGYKGMMLGFLSHMDDDTRTAWAKNQVYIALGQLMSTAAVLNVDACPMEGIIPPEYDKVLGLEDSGYTTVLACPMGYRSSEDKYAELAKVRYPVSQMIEHR